MAKGQNHGLTNLNHGFHQNTKGTLSINAEVGQEILCRRWRTM